MRSMIDCRRISGFLFGSHLRKKTLLQGNSPGGVEIINEFGLFIHSLS
jgi:hypothetical protein